MGACQYSIKCEDETRHKDAYQDKPIARIPSISCPQGPF